jgi:hypothetical protein
MQDLGSDGEDTCEELLPRSRYRKILICESCDEQFYLLNKVVKRRQEAVLEGFRHVDDVCAKCIAKLIFPRDRYRARLAQHVDVCGKPEYDCPQCQTFYHE